MPRVIQEYICDYPCPVEVTLDMIGGKWKGVIIYHLLQKKVLRYNQIRRILASAPRRTVTRQLRELEDAGIIHREVYPQVPPKVEYSLTERGQSLRSIITLMRDWGANYLGQEGYDTSNILCEDSLATESEAS